VSDAESRGRDLVSVWDPGDSGVSDRGARHRLSARCSGNDKELQPTISDIYRELFQHDGTAVFGGNSKKTLELGLSVHQDVHSLVEAWPERKSTLQWGSFAVIRIAAWTPFIAPI